MKVISTNIAKKRTIEIGGEKVETGIFKIPVNEGIVLGLTDVVQDDVVDRKYHGGEDMACYLFGKNNYGYFQNLYPDAHWETGMFGENITLDFLNEKELLIGSVYQLGEAIVQIAQPRIPCSKLGYRLGNTSAIKAFAESDFPGVYLRVIQPGKVAVGDEMVLKKASEFPLSVVDLYHILTNKSGHSHVFNQVLENPYVPESCKSKLKI